MKKKEISVHELHEIIKTDELENYAIVDVRSSGEYKTARIENAINIPLHELNKRKSELEKYDTVFLYCRSGGRSGKGCEKIQSLKEAKVVNVIGGLLEWEAEGFLLKRGKKAKLSILRQVHIVAGSLILTGVVLSNFLAYQWIFLSGFVGLGLLFAGLSGWCGMAHLLVRMPWNK